VFLACNVISGWRVPLHHTGGARIFSPGMQEKTKKLHHFDFFSYFCNSY